MALVNCPDCNKEISDSAEQCIHCGCPVKVVQKEQNRQRANKSVEDINDNPVMIKFNEYKDICRNEISKNQEKIDKLSLPLGIIGVPAIIFFVIMIFTLSHPDDSTIKTIGLFGFLATVIPVCVLAYISSSLENKNKYLLYDMEQTKNTLPKELLDVIKNKEKLDNQARYETLARLSSKNPKCPHCQSTSIKRISTTSRVISTSMVGLGSKKLGKSFECKSCGYTW